MLLPFQFSLDSLASDEENTGLYRSSFAIHRRSYSDCSEDSEEDDRDSGGYAQGSRPNKTKKKSKSKHSRHSATAYGGKGVLTDSSQELRRERRISEANDKMAGRKTSNSTGKRGGSSKGAAKSPPTGKKTSKDKALEKALQELEEQKRKNQEQQEKIQALTKKSQKNNTVGKMPVSTDIDAKVKDLSTMLGPKLWRTTKFINTSDLEKDACKIIMESMPEMKELLQGDEATIANNVGAFTATYGGTVCEQINDNRSNAQSGIKRAFLEFKSENPEFKMPTPKELIDIIKRKKEDLLFPPADQMPKSPDQNDFDDGEDSEEFKTQLAQWELDMAAWNKEQARITRNRTIFKWYWTKLLPCAAGKNRWSKNIRCYGCISSHSYPNNTDLKYVTTSDEALVAVLYENCGQRFPFLAEKADGAPTYQVTNEDKKNPRYQSAYSDCKAGQKKYGGWYEVGRTRFEQLEKRFRVHKKKEHVQALEKEILAEIQEEENIGMGKKKRKERSLCDFEERDDWRKVGVESDALSDIDEEEESDDDDFVVTYGKQKGESPSKKPRRARKARAKKDDSEDEEDEQEEDKEEQEENGDSDDEEEENNPKNG